MVFISGNIPSSKNSRMRTKAGFFITSKTVRNYLKEYEDQWKIMPEEFRNLRNNDFPIEVGFHFIRGSKHRWDFHNILQICADLMVKHGWIPDDNMDYFIPQCMMDSNGKYYGYDKENPGVYIKILKTNDQEEKANKD